MSTHSANTGSVLALLMSGNPPVPWAGISRVFQILTNRPRENTSKRVIVNLEVNVREICGEICGDVLLVYYCIY